MFDALASPALLAACILAGISFGTAVGVVGVQVVGRSRRTPVVRGGQEVRRKRAPRGFLAVVEPVLPSFVALGNLLQLTSVQATLAQRYARAGYPGGLEDEEILGASLVLGLLIAVLVGLLIALVQPLAAPLGLVMVVTGPGLLSSTLNKQGEKRELAITRTMPFVLDLLVLTMRAGASMQQAIERVALDYMGHPIGEEFSAILGDLDMGVTTREAFEAFGHRVPIDAVKVFVDDLVQGEELGRPLADIFERQATQARVRRVQQALDTAGRAKVLVLIPGMLVFMATLILLFAPFIVRWLYGGYALE